MKKISLKFLLIIAFITMFITGSKLYSQVPTVQDCLGAIPICQNTYSTTTSYFGEGNYPNELPLSGCLSLGGESNSVWYTFTVQTSGNFDFILTPNSSTDDYDWALFNLTNNVCSDLYNDFFTLMVSCNSSGDPGATGISTAMGGVGISNGPGTGTNKFNADLPVLAGQTYVLMISNWSSGTPGYNIDFSSSTAQIYDNVPPTMSSIASNIACGGNTLTLNFSENVQCSTVSTCDFTITGPGGPYTITNVVGANCSLGGTNEKTYTFTFTPAITTGGTFNLNLDASACSSVSDLCNNLAVSQSLPFTVSVMSPTISNVQNATCSINNGSATVNISGGSGNYTFLWNTSPAQSTATASNLGAGSYTVTINDGNCSTTASVTITATQTPSLSTTTTNGLCGTGGTATVTATGGSGFYTYTWSTVPQQTTQTAINLSSGTYMVTVNDGACTATVSVNITSSSPAIVLTDVPTNVSCFGGSNGAIDLTVSGGSQPFNFNWNNGTYTTQNLTNLQAGQYTVVVTDANNCQATLTINILQPPIGMTAVIVPANVGCYGGSNGSADLTVSGGTPPYSYLWNNTATTQDLLNLVFGTYCVTITDAAGCSTSICTMITQPTSALSAYLTGTNLTCYNVCTGLGVCHPSGGTPGFGGYTYLWSIGGIVNDSLIGACAGSYTCTVTDGSGCTTSASVVLTQPPQPAPLNVVPVNIPCYGECIGQVHLYYADILPTNSYSWTTGDTTQDIKNVCSGYYSVTVTDSAGCTRVADTVVSQPLMPLHDTIIVTNVACYFGHNGNINLTALGGTPGYTYQWLPNYQTTPDISNIFLGTDSLIYTITITDANSCTKTDSVTIHQPHAPLTATISGTNIKCNGASTGCINLTPAGGTIGNGYQFLWNTGANTQNLCNLPAGFYNVTITDIHGCDTIYSDTLTQPTAIVMALSPTNTSCTYNCFGGITSTVAGGIPSTVHGYTFSWNDGQTSPNDTLLCVGTYTLTVTDSLGCINVDSASINSNSHIIANGSANPVTGNSPVDINFTFMGSGATSYDWNFGDGSFSNVPNPVHIFVTPASAPGQPAIFNVILLVKDSLCSDTFKISIEVNPSSIVTVPNVFTPNGDGQNDVFLIKGEAIETFDCEIFNRWGKKVFEWNDISQGWDGKISGKDASDGVYYYILKARGQDGKTYDMHGIVTLIR